MTDRTLVIAREPFGSDDARRLVGSLDLEESAGYPPENVFGPNLRAEHVDGGNGEFLVGRVAGVAVACGAVRRRVGGTFEVKRMYVDPAHRRRGFAREVLRALEDAARSLGADRLVLETGDRQEAAMRLYEAMGFRAIECFDEYSTSSTSRCYEKRVAP